MNKVNLAEKLALFSDHWKPRVVGELNGQQVRLVKAEGEFVWHSHAHEDELFLVLRGRLELHFRDRMVEIGEGDRSAISEAINALMGSKPEARFRFIQEHAAFAHDLDI